MNRFHLRRQCFFHELWDWLPAAIVLSLVVSGSGCNKEPMGGPRVEVVPVTGKVFVDGKPAEGVVVYFRRVSDLKVDLPVPPPVGYTDKNGVISLSSYVSNDGGIPGEYKLCFEKSNRVNPFTGEATGDMFRGKYSDMNKSEYTVTIPEDVGDEPFDIGTIELSSAQPSKSR